MSFVAKVTHDLNSNWIWVPDWTDSSDAGSAGRIVTFTRSFTLDAVPDSAIIHCTADTRYKLFVNDHRVAVGPTRSTPASWFYDTLDLAPFLRRGHNDITFHVLRFFPGLRAALPFVRSPVPGLTVTGHAAQVDLSTASGWEAEVQGHIQFPTGLEDDVFLHINERVQSPAVPRSGQKCTPIPYGFTNRNGELLPWRLKPRAIPMQEQNSVQLTCTRCISSSNPPEEWTALCTGAAPIRLPPHSTHAVHIQAEHHSTAFLRLGFRSYGPAKVTVRITYSEGYEREPRLYPWLRTKDDRLDQSGLLLGPHDLITLEVNGEASYEPFWFRTFRLIHLEIAADAAVDVLSLSATQTNYPLAVKAKWHQPDDPESSRIWEICTRTVRNCLFDGYSDCPFYEQLQYAGDTRTVGMFHYLLSGDDRLMRQAITSFAASMTPEGLTQSRYPSHVPQIILGFPLYWILTVCDHYLYFGDARFIRSLLPHCDAILEFFANHVDELGLVSGVSEDIWQYVDWVDTWVATPDHPDKGVPLSGRRTNRHTFFSMLYAYTLRQAAHLLNSLGRKSHQEEYLERSNVTVRAIRRHCFDGSMFTDSTLQVADNMSYSQHCQVFAVLCGAATAEEAPNLLRKAFSSPISKCSYFMMFYAFRAFSLAGSGVYEDLLPKAMNSWRKMLANNMSTVEEDDVRQRSDCHAWTSVPIYEYCTEIAGVKPLRAGCSAIMFAPRLALAKELSAKVCLGSDNVATVTWRETGTSQEVMLRLMKPVDVFSQLPGEELVHHGIVSQLRLM